MIYLRYFNIRNVIIILMIYYEILILGRIFEKKIKIYIIINQKVLKNIILFGFGDDWICWINY